MINLKIGHTEIDKKWARGDEFVSFFFFSVLEVVYNLTVLVSCIYIYIEHKLYISYG
jgi:hypothetical protein